METVVCDLCSSSETTLYLELPDRFNGEMFRLVKCAVCNHIYLNPRPEKDEIGKYYPPNYEQHQAIPQSEELINRTEYHAANILMDFTGKYTTKKGRLLDVGCATGIFLKVAEASGWLVVGIELIEAAAQIAREQYNLNVHVGSIENVNSPAESFDMITFWDVMEHLPSPSQAMKKCYELLRPGGLVFFTTPNLASFDRHIFGKYWIGWELPRHFHLLTPSSAARLLSNTGFKYVDDRCVLGGKGTFFLSLDTWLNAHKRNGYLLHKFYPSISAILWPYRKLSYFLKRGPIITYVAQK